MNYIDYIKGYINTNNLLALAGFIFFYIIIKVMTLVYSRRRLVKKLDIQLTPKIRYLAESRSISNSSMTYNELESEIYSHCEKYDNSIRLYLSSFTAIGLLFTFIGLVFAVSNISAVLRSLSGANFTEVLDKISPILSNMDLAFYSSLIGLTLSVFFGFYNTGNKNKDEELIKKYIYQTRIKIMPEYAPKTMESQLKGYIDKFHESISGMFEAYNNKMELSLTNFNKLSDKVATQLLLMFNTKMKEIINSFQTTSDNMHAKYADTFTGFSESLASLEKCITKDNMVFEKMVVTVDKSEKRIAGNMSKFSSIIDDFSDKLSIINQFSIPLQAFIVKFDKIISETDKLVEAINKESLSSSKNSENITNHIYSLSERLERTNTMLEENAKEHNNFVYSILSQQKENLESYNNIYNTIKEYSDKSAVASQNYLNTLSDMIGENNHLATNLIKEASDKTDKLMNFKATLDEYIEKFDHIINNIDSLSGTLLSQAETNSTNAANITRQLDSLNQLTASTNAVIVGNSLKYEAFHDSIVRQTSHTSEAFKSICETIKNHKDILVRYLDDYLVLSQSIYEKNSMIIEILHKQAENPKNTQAEMYKKLIDSLSRIERAFSYHSKETIYNAAEPYDGSSYERSDQPVQLKRKAGFFKRLLALLLFR